MENKEENTGFALIASSGTKQGIEKMVNEYFFSSGYTVSTTLLSAKKVFEVKNSKGELLKNFKVELKKGRYRLLQSTSLKNK